MYEKTNYYCFYCYNAKCPKLKTCERECWNYVVDEYNRLRNGKEQNKKLIKILHDANNIIHHHHAYDDLTEEKYEEKLKYEYTQLRMAATKKAPEYTGYNLPPFRPYEDLKKCQKNGHKIYIDNFIIHVKETGEIIGSKIYDELLYSFNEMTIQEQKETLNLIKIYRELPKYLQENIFAEIKGMQHAVLKTQDNTNKNQNI